MVYYLSGLTCTDDNAVQKGGAFKAAAEKGVMFVFPDTSPRGAGVAGEDESWDLGTGAGFYVDATSEPWSTHYNMYSYVTEELPALIESNFSVTSLKSVTGHSMGGLGALAVAFKNPDAYASVSAFAPIAAPTAVPWGDKAFGAYFGKDAPSQGPEYDPCALLAKRGRAFPQFDDVLVDIGDSQDLMQSLSTFSARLAKQRAILRACTPRALVLMDEVGTGTSPAEGAAIGGALLERLAGAGGGVAADDLLPILALLLVFVSEPPPEPRGVFAADAGAVAGVV